MNVQIEESWKAHLQPEFEKDYFRTLTRFCTGRIWEICHISSGKADIQCIQPMPF